MKNLLSEMSKCLEGCVNSLKTQDKNLTTDLKYEMVTLNLFYIETPSDEQFESVEWGLWGLFISPQHAFERIYLLASQFALPFPAVSLGFSLPTYCLS